jgi:hypothetical protein
MRTITGLGLGATIAFFDALIYLYWAFTPLNPSDHSTFETAHATGLRVIIAPFLYPYYWLGVLLAFAVGIVLARWLPKLR